MEKRPAQGPIYKKQVFIFCVMIWGYVFDFGVYVCLQVLPSYHLYIVFLDISELMNVESWKKYFLQDCVQGLINWLAARVSTSIKAEMLAVCCWQTQAFRCALTK